MYLVKDLRKTKPEAGKLYLFDANVWHLILNPPWDILAYEQVYINFFDSLIDLASNPGANQPPRIYLNGLIISEVFNSCLRSKWDMYRDDTGKDISYKQYRATEDFVKSAGNIISDFDAYSHALMIETDLLLNPFEMLLSLPTSTDYNDYYYYSLAMEKNMAIVTNDSDFAFQGCEILTNNNQLLTVTKKKG